MRLAYVCKNFYVPMYVKTQPFIAWMFIMEDEKFYVPMYVKTEPFIAWMFIMENEK